jgi:hypothetical protein
MAMTKGGLFLSTMAGLVLVGCASGPPYIQTAEPMATQAAQRRAQFDMDCKDVMVETLTREMVQSPLEYTRFAPPQRAEYTLGATGCGQRKVYLVMCTDGAGGCVAVSGR